MNLKFLFEKLGDYQIYNKADYLEQAFSRNIGLFTLEEQEKLSNAAVGIPGMGGVGGVHFMTMVRTGIGKFHLSDFDVFEPANINRQFGARIPDMGRSKLEVMQEQGLSVNPYLEVKEFSNGISDENVDEFLDGLDVVMDSLDFFAFDARRMLFKRAKEKGIHVITAGPLGFSSAMLIFAPDRGMGFDEYFNIVDGMSSEEKYLSFALGLAPKAVQFKYMDTSKVSFKSGKGPSLNLACQLCSSLAGTEAVRIILGKEGLKPVPYYFQFDPFVQKYYRKKLNQGNRNFLQRMKFKIVRKMIAKHDQVLPPSLPEELSKADIFGDKGATTLSRPARDYLIQTGVLAPSADNCQPWLFSWEDNTLMIQSDPKRTHFFYDVNQESTLITFGALAENLSLAASTIGLEAVIGPVSLSQNKDVSVEIEFKEKNAAPDPLASFIPYRCINRKPFGKAPLDRDHIQKIENVFRDSAEVNLKWITDPEGRKDLQKIIYLSDRVLFEEKRLHEGLFKFIRMGDEMFPSDGMNLGVLELSQAQKKIFPLFSQWKYQSLMNKFMISRAMALNSIQLLKKTPGYALLTLKEKTAQGYFEAGRKMERFWITANSLGMAVQPMAGFVFLVNHYYHNNARHFKPLHQKMIYEMKEKLGTVLGKADKEDAPVMFFRLGYAPPQKNRTGRRDLKEIVKA